MHQGWIDCVEALMAARVTGRFALAGTRRRGRRSGAGRCWNMTIEKEITGLRARATKETQMNRRVEWNLEIRRLEQRCAAACEIMKMSTGVG